MEITTFRIDRNNSSLKFRYVFKVITVFIILVPLVWVNPLFKLNSNFFLRFALLEIPLSIRERVMVSKWNKSFIYFVTKCILNKLYYSWKCVSDFFLWNPGIIMSSTVSSPKYISILKTFKGNYLLKYILQSLYWNITWVLIIRFSTPKACLNSPLPSFRLISATVSLTTISCSTNFIWKV